VRISNLYLYGTGADMGSGIYALTTSTGLTVDHCIIENWGYHGILIESSAYPRILDNQVISNIRNGLNMDTVTYGLIRGNKINTNTRHGIWMDDCSYNILTQNVVLGNDSANAATYDGININHSAGTSNYNQIYGNTVSNNDRYEINISTASCTGNHIGKNNLYGTDREGVMSDSGTATKLLTHTIPFTGGTAQLTADAAAWGYEIDLAAEFAIGYSNLPLDLHQVVRWKIYAQSIVLEADGMELLIEGQGGSDNAAFNAQAVSVASEGSVSTNFAANDWIYWQVDPADDVDIDDFAAGDHIQIKVTFAAADGGNCATDATFTCTVIEYV